MNTRKGLGKGLGCGYKNLAPMDAHIHSLSAKGCKTYSKLMFAKKTLKAEGKKLDITSEDMKRYKELTDDFINYDLTAEELKEIEDDVSEITSIEDNDTGDGWLTLKFGKDEEWTLAPSEDDAEKVARERVEEDLDNEPELFTPSWLEGHINTDNLRNQLESDVSDSNQNYYDDIESEKDKQYDNRLIRELIDGNYLDEDEYTEKKEDIEKLEEDEEPNQELIDKIQKEIDDAVDKAKEEAVEKKTEEDLEDPIEYLEGIYGKGDAMKEAIRIGGINTEDAVDDAISQDGWQHFLSHYDGGSTDLKSGKVMWRE